MMLELWENMSFDSDNLFSRFAAILENPDDLRGDVEAI